jgi:hypothetical protein
MPLPRTTTADTHARDADHGLDAVADDVPIAGEICAACAPISLTPQTQCR